MIEKLFDGNMFLAITTNDPETMEQKLDKIKDYKCLKSPCHGLIYHIPENGMGGGTTLNEVINLADEVDPEAEVMILHQQDNEEFVDVTNMYFDYSWGC